VGITRGYPRKARLRLWALAGQAHFSDEFEVAHDWFDAWSASFNAEGHGCTVIIGSRKHGTREMHQWTISANSVEKCEGQSTLRNALPPPRMDASVTAKLLLKGKGTRLLAVHRSARGKDCTCTAVAHFENNIWDYCAWSSLVIPGGPSTLARNHSTVVVALQDGTVHLMEFCV
jgi:hypothetical protein